MLTQLRGDIHLSSALKSVKYSHLSALVADYLLRVNPEAADRSEQTAPAPLSFALNVLPKTLKGLDVNVNLLNGGFEKPVGLAGDGGELELFELAKVPIRHGWIVTEGDADIHDVLKSGNITSYDQAINRLVEGDEIAGGSITSQSDADTAKLDKLFEELSPQPNKQAKVYQGERRLEQSLENRTRNEADPSAPFEPTTSHRYPALPDIFEYAANLRRTLPAVREGPSRFAVCALSQLPLHGAVSTSRHP